MINKKIVSKTSTSKYALRGVSADKRDVHAAIQNLSIGLFPSAFCNAISHPFPWADKDSIWFLHADGVGTKASLAYLYWKESGDITVFEDLAQDAIVMNTDDLACVGAIDSFVLSNSIGRNKRLIPREVLSALMRGVEKFIANVKPFDVNIITAGGETADVGDIVKTLMVDATMLSCVAKKNFIDNKNIQSGQVIVGLSSFGKATYESSYNSGIGSNGLTYARHELLNKIYQEKYPESFDDDMSTNLVYSGRYKLADKLPNTPLNIGQALLSPTRTYLPILKKIFALHRKNIYGLIHCTGGGQTKCLKFSNHMHYVKDNLFPLPPLFKTLVDLNPQPHPLQLKELFEVFNCGHRLEIYTQEKIALDLIHIANDFDVEAKIIGHTENNHKSNQDVINHNPQSNGNRLTLKYQNNFYHYS